MATKWKSLTGEICDISCPRSGKYAGQLYCSSCSRSEKVYLERSAIFNVYSKLCCNSCPQSGKVQLENCKIFHVHEVERFDWSDLQYFMATKCKSVTGDIYDTSCPQNGKFN